MSNVNEPVWTQEIAVGQIWRAPDGRLLRVVGVERGQPVAVRNVETNRLNYQPLKYFDPAQKWHLVLQSAAVSPQEDAAPPLDLEAIKAEHLAGMRHHDAIEAMVCRLIEEVEQSRTNNRENKLIAEENSRRADRAEAEIKRLRSLTAPSLLAVPEGRLRELIRRWRFKEESYALSEDECVRELSALLTSMSHRHDDSGTA